MCKWGTTRNVLVKIPEDLSCTGYARMKHEAIDACIAPIVEALQRGCIDMRGSCCGHGKGVGDIHLQDGRVLIIADYKQFLKHREQINELLLLRKNLSGGMVKKQSTPLHQEIDKLKKENQEIRDKAAALLHLPFSATEAFEKARKELLEIICKKEN